MKINGLLIDCSRLLERHKYYFRLVDFMADWGMNLLVLHFTDDAGCAVKLPGFEQLAMPHAFTAAEVRKLIRHAARRGIEIVPEIETFGHTRCITDRKEFHHLYAGPPGKQLVFNAIDPLNPETWKLMGELLKSVVRLFPSHFIHVGCDEVNLTEYCQQRKLDADQVWADYVNRIFDLTRGCGKAPMFWADHPLHSPRIASRLQKNVMAIWWNYSHLLKVSDLKRLQKAGFRRILAAPSTANYSMRFLTPRRQLVNVRKMAVCARRYRLDGVLNTVWTTTRYSQGAMYYGIAYSAFAARHPDGTLCAFNQQFARKVFGTGLTRDLAAFLNGWIKMDIHYRVTLAVMKKERLERNFLDTLEKTRQVGERILPLANKYTPARNRAIWEAMALAAKTAWVCAAGALLMNGRKLDAARKQTYNQFLRETRREMSRDWDRTRFPDDPKKHRPQFPSPVEAAQHALIILRHLPVALASDRDPRRASS
ncbi:MAG: family 20 glycosylhydrolase [Verrucomicrobia bacterium]|nr:family 20 glycosylhydrolase [Verrucomicrobiota bacterium]